MSDHNFVKLRAEKEPIYKSIGKVYCPYFNETVSFNSKGLEHLKFQSKGRPRSRMDKYIRLKNIELAPLVVKCSKTLQEMRVAKELIDVKTNKRTDTVLKSVTYYGFTAIIDTGGQYSRVKIIVKEVEGGKKHFWSLIPNWKNNRSIDYFSGNPSED